MKLELKHLAPYLPYGLKLWYKEKLPLSEFLEKKVEQHSIEMKVVTMMACLGGASKPILRPLSDLTKDKVVIGWNDNKLSKYSKSVSLEYDSYNDIQYLLSLHFDVFGLIPKGLAVDINTLKI